MSEPEPLESVREQLTEQLRSKIFQEIIAERVASVERDGQCRVVAKVLQAQFSDGGGRRTRRRRRHRHRRRAESPGRGRTRTADPERPRHQGGGGDRCFEYVGDTMGEGSCVSGEAI